MIQRPKWWNSPIMFLGWVILSGVIVNLVIKTPNTIGGGEGVMIVMLVLAVVLNGTFQFIMTRRQKRKDDKLNSPN